MVSTKGCLRMQPCVFFHDHSLSSELKSLFPKLHTSTPTCNGAQPGALKKQVILNRQFLGQSSLQMENVSRFYNIQTIEMKFHTKAVCTQCISSTWHKTRNSHAAYTWWIRQVSTLASKSGIPRKCGTFPCGHRCKKASLFCWNSVLSILQFMHR